VEVVVVVVVVEVTVLVDVVVVDSANIESGGGTEGFTLR